MTKKDQRGIPITGANQKMISRLEAAHEMSLVFDGDAIAALDELLRDHPNFIMAHCMKAGLLTQAMETRIYDEMLASVIAAEKLINKANDRERGHIAALNAWIDGDFYAAVERWDEVLIDYPRDLLALQLVHLSNVLLGDIANERDSVTRVFHAWDEGVPGYGYVLSFLSFGAEESRDFTSAEELGRRALAINSKDCYAIHAVAHVMEMQGRQQGGIWWMQSRQKDWTGGNFANHLWWHLSLFHLDLGQTDKVLDIYDTALRDKENSSDKYSELDAAALLWRLNLLGVDVGGRWSELADKWKNSATDSLYAFNDVHAMMAFVADGRENEAGLVLNAAERYVQRASDANVAMTRVIGLPFCRALQAFAKGDYDSAVDQLLPVRYQTHHLGGSHAQRDIIAWTLLEAALRSKRWNLAVSLANERTYLKPTSPQNWHMLARGQEGCGNNREANISFARAEAGFGG